MDELVKLSKIFSDQNRVLILALVLRDEKVCVCEICDTLNLSQPLVSRHLKKMKDSGILDVKQDRKWMLYSLTDDVSQVLEMFIDQIKIYINTLPKLVVCKSK